MHGDPAGYNKLTRLLRHVGVRMISVEISEYSWRYRRRRQGRWRRQFQLASADLPPEGRGHLALQKVAAQIAYPFEVRAVEDYARDYGAGWRAVDLNGPAREHLPRYEAELLRPENLRALLATADGDWRDYIRQEYRRARRVLETGRGQGINLEGAAPPLTTLREKVLAQRVGRLAKAWGKIVHVGGWEHLAGTEGKRRMVDFLAGLRPAIILLDESSSEI